MDSSSLQLYTELAVWTPHLQTVKLKEFIKKAVLGNYTINADSSSISSDIPRWLKNGLWNTTSPAGSYVARGSRSR